MASAIAPNDVARRRDLQALYVASIKADGIMAVHRLLSEAVIAAKNEKARGKSKLPLVGAKMQWQGQQIEIGPAMAALNDRRRLYVMHFVRGEMRAREAAKAAGYRGKSPEKNLKASRGVRDAIAEERCRR